MFEFTSLEPASAPRFATQKIKFSRTLLLQLSLAVELHLPPSRLFELQSGAFVLLSQNPAQVLRCENTEPAKLRREDA
ncbi:uncharacterized protein [Malus domestica]|uniref:uncharacterized protein isoform X2 n=1 Tax=Malus domestica TaxID=3750 RepID=UPI0039747888